MGVHGSLWMSLESLDELVGVVQEALPDLVVEQGQD